MALQEVKNGRSDADLIRNVLATRGTATPKGKDKSPEAPVFTASVDQVVRQVRRLYKDRIDTNLDDKDRIVNAIHWLTTEFPGQTVPLTLLYWMCYGGTKLKTPDSDDVQRFSKKVSRHKKYMLTKHNRSFLLRAGMIRGYVSREEHTHEELPRAIARAKGSIQYANLVAQAVGNASTLQLPADKRSEVQSMVEGVANMLRAIPQLTVGDRK